MFENKSLRILVWLFMPMWVLGSTHIAKAEPTSEETLEYINSFCSRHQLRVENGKLMSADMSFIPSNYKGNRFLGVTSTALDLSKVVSRLISLRVIVGQTKLDSKGKGIDEVFWTYQLKCKTQNCITFKPPQGLQGKGNTANKIGFPQVVEAKVDVEAPCIKAFHHLSKLHGATAPAKDMFK